MADGVDSSALGRARPIRMCIGCRERAPQAALLRVVAVVGSADAVAVLDQRRQRFGRGAYLHPSLRCFESADRRRALPRALRLTVPLDLSAVRTEIERLSGETTKD